MEYCVNYYVYCVHMHVWDVSDDSSADIVAVGVTHAMYCYHTQCTHLVVLKLQKAAKDIRVLIVGAGPVGLRLAIDCILLGSEVIVIEKRNTFSRNNVLHLWPFTIDDLRQLGAKKFYGKFCAGAIDHISEYQSLSIIIRIDFTIFPKGTMIFVKLVVY